MKNTTRSDCIKMAYNPEPVDIRNYYVKQRTLSVCDYEVNQTCGEYVDFASICGPKVQIPYIESPDKLFFRDKGI